MATWNELFMDEKFIAAIPQPEVYKFVKVLEGIFPARPLSIWDFCCGAGRHTVLISQMGHNAYGSDISVNGINHTQKWLKNNMLNASLKVSDMTGMPFSGMSFHGAVSWDALHHNTISNISKAVEIIYDSLCIGGMFMVSLLSTKSGSFLTGKEIEKNTFVGEEGPEAGVPHYYFDEQGVRGLFRKWKIVSLVEIIATYKEANIDYAINPFPYTKWYAILRK